MMKFNEDFKYVNTEAKKAKSITITYEDGSSEEVDMQGNTYTCVPWEEYNKLKTVYLCAMKALERSEK